ncbi:alpha/beta hydrolase [Reichenbachiella sp. MALMAid0571]|uniref:serine aminopeptidase domain-containing protein n=1 Tax=Reichenbachiella sp. MALMAid0571 TaxID=3143939 RepID=UPI0032DF65BD
MNTKKTLLLFILLIASISLSLALNPSKEYKKYPTDLKFKEQKVQTPDGYSLNTWYFPSTRTSNKLIIVSHNGDGNMGDNVARIKSFISLGFNVLCYDYRGFGSSSDFKIDNETYLYSEFYKDFETVYNYALKNHGKKIYLYGWGIGATISITIGYTRSHTYSIVADGAISRFVDLPQKFFKIGSRMSLDSEVSSRYKDPYTVLSETPSANFRGILFIIGSKNYLFTENDANELKSQVKNGMAEVFVMQNSRFADNFKDSPSDYTRKVSQFLINN